MGTGQNFTKKILHGGSFLHESKKTGRYFCKKTLLLNGTKLHEDTFARGVIFARIEFLLIFLSIQNINLSVC